MKPENFVSPIDHKPLKLVDENQPGSSGSSKYFLDAQNHQFPILDGIPNLTYPFELNEVQKEQLQYYETMADQYDSVQNLTFAIQGADEEKVRKEMVQELKLNPSDKALEIACGTGLDSQNIAAQLDESGELFLQDISMQMLKKCQKKLRDVQPYTEFVVANGSYLPFADHYFDAIFSFGGINVFEDPKASLKEMVRVVKPGGRIVFGDESMPPWLADTEFAKVLLNTNPLFNYELPLKILPIEARNVSVKWIIGGVYYLISFDVGVGEPKANFDIPIPGRRGGTLNTRYHGQLEGVSLEIKEKVMKAAKDSHMSIHDWLNQSLEQVLEAKECEQNV